MADNIFEDPRLARVYDPLDPDRSDLDVYVAIVAELGARAVLDVGCGTGTLRLPARWQRGIEVTGVDPAAASLDVARSQAGRRRGALAARRRDDAAAAGRSTPRS